MHTRYISLSLSALLLLSPLLTGCPANKGQFSSLINQGLLPVSAENPYVGSNLFLAHEMERSAFLLNFFRSKGSPQAIELMGNDADSAEMKLFYAERKEVYYARPSINTQIKSKEWIIRGPYGLGREYFKEIGKLPTSTRGVFEIYGAREYFGGAAVPQRTIELQPVFVPTPRPTPRPVIRRRPTVSPETLTPTPAPEPSPMNFDQRALLEAKQRALATPVPAAPTAGLIIINAATPVPKAEAESPKTEAAKVESPPIANSPAATQTEHPATHDAHVSEKGHVAEGKH